MISSWWGDGPPGGDAAPVERAATPSARPPISETQDMLNAMSSLLARLNKPQPQNGNELKGLADEFTFRWQTISDAGEAQNEDLRRELNSARNHELELARELLQLRQTTSERDCEVQAALSAAAHDEILELQHHNSVLEMHMAELQGRDIPLSRCLGELNDALRRELADKTKENLALQQSMQGLAAQVTDLEGMFAEVMYSRPDPQSAKIGTRCSACSGPLQGRLRTSQAQASAGGNSASINETRNLLNLRTEQVESYMATVVALSSDLESSRNRALELMHAAETSDAHLANSEQDVERIKSKATELEQLVQKHGSRLAELEKELQRSRSTAHEQEELVLHHEKRALALDEQLKVQRMETAMYRSRSSFLSAMKDGMPKTPPAEDSCFREFESHVCEVREMASVFRHEIYSVKQATSEAHAAREQDWQYAAAITGQLEERLRHECHEAAIARDEADWLREELRIKDSELSRLNNSEVNAERKERRALSPGPAIRKVTFSTTGTRRHKPAWEAEDAATVQERLRQRICDLTSNGQESLPSSQQNSVTSQAGQACADMLNCEQNSDLLARHRYPSLYTPERPVRPEVVYEQLPAQLLSQVSSEIEQPALDSPLLSQTTQPPPHAEAENRTPSLSSPLQDQEAPMPDERGSSILDGLTKLYAAGATGAVKKAGLPPALPQHAPPQAAPAAYRASSPTASPVLRSCSLLRGVQTRIVEPTASPVQRPREALPQRTRKVDPGTPPAPRSREAALGTPPQPGAASPLIRCPSFHKDIRQNGGCFAARTAAALSSVRSSSLTARFGDKQDALNEGDSNTQPAWRSTLSHTPAIRPPVSTTPVASSPVMSASAERVVVFSAVRMHSSPAPAAKRI